MLVLCILFSCKKDKDDPPVDNSSGFSAPGFWRGVIAGRTATLGFGVLNRANGTCRVYDLANGPDTTQVAKLDGTYTVTGDYYRAHIPGAGPGNSIFLETTSTTARIMKGIITIDNGGAGYFEFIKQP